VELATLRHELLHAVLESNAAPGHPEWLREGLVQALLQEQSASAGRVRELIAKQGLAKILEQLRKPPVTN
jgi:hypothetical protein